MCVDLEPETRNSAWKLLLDVGEGNLSKQGVVVVSQIFTVDKTKLGEYIGTLSRTRVRQILAGIDLLLQPRDAE